VNARRGTVAPIDQRLRHHVYAVLAQGAPALSARWYEGRLALDYQRPPGPHYQALVAAAGLTGEAWSLTPPPAG
jgi:hypothetical protein